MKIYLDCETCGLHGLPIIVQYAYDDGPVHIHNFWTRPISESMTLIESFLKGTVVGFNITFDWFHIVKIYSIFKIIADRGEEYWFPVDHVQEIAILEEKARWTKLCLKPEGAFDVMLHARKTEFQSLMERDDIRIRRVPTPLAWQLAKELEKRIVFDEIYFARAKDKYAPRWKVYDIERPDGSINPDFKDIKLKFKASGSLKNLYRHAFKIKEQIFTFRDVEVDRRFWPEEVGYAPFALAIGTPENWKHAWPDVIAQHIRHWDHNTDARKYASDDVIYTRRLYAELFNSPPVNDNDSVLAIMVANCRWAGYAVDVPALKILRTKALQRISNIPVAPRVVGRYIRQVMNDEEKMGLGKSTKKVVLQEVATWLNDDGSMHPAAVRAREVLNARVAQKEIELFDKLIQAGRFHASFKIIGTLTSRMAGADGLNPQGINHSNEVREVFTLADTDLEDLAFHTGIPVERLQELISILCGGDFDSFEVSIAAAVFDDETLNEEIRSGKKIHALLGMELFPGKTYDEIKASAGAKYPLIDMYDTGKKGVFLLIYGGNANTFQTKLGIDLEIGEAAYQRFLRKRPKILAFNKKVEEDFGALVQAGGLGTRIEYRQPKEYVESFLGFRRYFTLENRIVKTLFELAQKPPAHWRDIRIKVLRRDRIQTACGAVASALYAAAFGIVSAIQRAVKNHYIQSPGASITKAVQVSIWSLQPFGVSTLIVMPMNIHDELMCPAHPNLASRVKEKVMETVQVFKKQVPLLAISWLDAIDSWAGKKGSSGVPASQIKTPGSVDGSTQSLQHA